MALTVTGELNRLAGTTGQGMNKAANVWAGTTGLDALHALNVKAGNVLPNFRDLAGVCNQLASTSKLPAAKALSTL